MSRPDVIFRGGPDRAVWAVLRWSERLLEMVVV